MRARRAYVTPPLDQSAVDHQRAVVANGGTMSRARLIHNSWLIRQLQAYGIWDLTDDFFAICPESGNTVQGLVSLKQRRLGTLNGSMAFVDGAAVFNGGYIATGFIPSSHASQMTGTNMRMMTWQTSNAPSGYAAGTLDTSSKNIAFRPKTSSRLNASLNSTAVSSTGSTFTDASGFSGASRNSSSANAPITFWKDGAQYDSPVATGTSTNVIPTREIFIGGYNNAGTGVATTITGGRLRWLDVGATLTSQQHSDYYRILVDYFTRLAPGASIYVSSVSYGGIGIGNDSTGLGTDAAPYLTFDVGVIATPGGGTLLFNGDSASPPTYNCTTSVTKAITFKAINALGAKLAGTGTSRAFLIAPTSGQTVAFENAIVDATANTSGPAARAVQISSVSTAFRFDMRGCTVKDWNALEGVTAPSASAKVFADFSNCTFTCTNARGAIVFLNQDAGAVVVDGCTATVTGNTTGYGAVFAAATATGVVSSITNTNVTMTVGGSASGTGRIYATRIQNIANGLIDGGTHQVIGTGTSDGTKRGYGVGIGTNEAGDATELSIDGGIVRNLSVHCTTYGGIAAYIGGDNNDPTKATNLLMEDVTITGDAQFIAGGGHGAFMTNTTDSILRRVNSSGNALNLVDKGSTGGTIEYCTAADATTSAILLESSTNCTVRNNTVTLNSSSNPIGIHFYQNVSPLGPVTSGAVVENNTFTCSGATGAVFVMVDAGSSGTFRNNTYVFSSGTLATYPFVYDGVNLTKEQWLAQVEPTATFVGF